MKTIGKVIRARSFKFCALIGCQFAQNVQTKCAKLVDEKNYKLFCCLSVLLDFESKILFKGVHLTSSEKLFDRKLYCL